MNLNPDALVQLIFQKGLKNVNLSMFSDDEKRAVLEQVAEVYVRQGKMNEVLEILEIINLNKFSEIMKPIAEACLERGDYKKAALIYDRIGEKEMAAFIRANFINDEQ